MAWRLFDKAAAHYDAWYDTPRGQRVERAERALLSELLAEFPGAQSLLEVGCGTGRFSAWLAPSFRVVGVDRSPAMLAQMRARHATIPTVLGDAYQLPLPDGAIDLVLYATTLEFLDDPLAALCEAVRVARRGLLLLVLNRWSAGGLSRRVGPQARGALLGRARDLTVLSLGAMAREAAGVRLAGLPWASTLFPDGLWTVRARLPFGDVLGMAVVLAEPNREGASTVRVRVSRKASARTRRPRPCTAFPMRGGRGARWSAALATRHQTGATPVLHRTGAHHAPSS